MRKKISLFIGIMIGILFSIQNSYAFLDVNNSFSPAALFPKQISTYTIKIQNSSLVESTDVNFEHALPEGIFISDSNNITNTCGGILTPTNNENNGIIIFSGGIAPAGDGSNSGSCSITVDVYAAKKGNYSSVFAVGGLKGTTDGEQESNLEESKATLTAVLTDFSIGSKITPSSIYGGGKSTMSIEFTNPNEVSLTNLSIPKTDLYSYSSIVNDSFSSTCGGNLLIEDITNTSDYIRDGSSFTYSGGEIPANGECRISFDITNTKKEKELYRGVGNNIKIEKNSLITNEGATNSNLINKTYNTYTGIRLFNSLGKGGTDTVLIPYDSDSVDITQTIEIRNYNVTPDHDINNFDLDIPLVEGLEYKSATNTCGGAVNKVGENIKLTGGSLKGTTGNGSKNCQIQIVYTANTPDTYTHTLSGGGLNQYKYSTDIDEVIVQKAQPLKIEKEFSRDGFKTIYYYQGDTLILDYILTNVTDETNGINLENIHLYDELTDKDGWCSDVSEKCLRITDTVTTSCVDANINSSIGNNIVDVSGIKLAKGESCKISVPIVSRADIAPYSYYDYINGPSEGEKYGDVTYNIEGSTALSGNTEQLKFKYKYFYNSLNLQKVFAPDITGSGGISRLELTPNIRSNTDYKVNNISFIDDLPDGMIIAEDPDIENTCGGTLTAVPGAGKIELSGGDTYVKNLTSRITRTCKVYVNVRAPLIDENLKSQDIRNSIPRNNHGDSLLNYTANKVGEEDIYSRFENTTRTINDTLTVYNSSVALNKSYLTTTIKGGAAARVRVSFSNISPESIDLTKAAFTDEYEPNSVRLFTDVDPTYSCGDADFEFQPGDTKITIKNAQIPKGKTCYFEYNVTSVIGGNHIDDVSESSLTTLQNVTNLNESSTTLTVERNINVAKTFNPIIVTQGEESELVLEIFNTQRIPEDENGTTPALIDEMPEGVELLEITDNPCGGTTSIIKQNGNDALRLDGGLFEAESSCKIKAKVKSETPGKYTNTIAVGDLTTLNGKSNPNDAEATLTVIEKPIIEKKVSKASIPLGDTSTFTIDITNPNSATLLSSGITKVRFEDELPTGLTIDNDNQVSASSGCSTDYEVTATPGSNNFSITNLGVKPNTKCSISFKVKGDVSGGYNNTISELNFKESQSSVGPSNTVELTVKKPLSVLKTFELSTIFIENSATLKFSIKNENTTSESLTGTGLVDHLPMVTGGQMQLADPIDFTTNGCEELPALMKVDGSTTSEPGDTSFKLINGKIAAGGTCDISLKVKATAPGKYDNTTEKIVSTAGLGNASSASLTVENTPRSNLITKKSVDKSNPKEEENIVYTISVKNEGPQEATNVTLTDKIPDGVTYISHEGDGEYNTDTGVWKINSIANGSTSTLRITAKVNKGTVDTEITNTTSVALTSDQVDESDAGNILSAPIGVEYDSINLVTKKSVHNTEPKIGENLVYTITTENLGDDVANNVKIKDNFSKHTTYLSHSGDGEFNPETAVWNIGDIAKGEKKQLVITTSMDSKTVGDDIINTVDLPTFADDQIDSSLEGDMLSVKSKVTNTPPTIVANNMLVVAGESVDLLELPRASDPEDGDITSSITIKDDGGFDNMAKGEYSITYTVTDSHGATTDKIIKVNVTDGPPVIMGEDKTIVAGQPLDLLELVTAQDIEDGDITSNITIKDDGGFDNMVMGVYNVVYTVTDSDNKTVEKTLNITVTNAPPVISAEDQSIVAFTQVDLLDFASAKDLEDGDITSDIIVLDDGGFKYFKSGEYEITYQVTDSNNETTQKIITITVTPTPSGTTYTPKCEINKHLSCIEKDGEEVWSRNIDVKCVDKDNLIGESCAEKPDDIPVEDVPELDSAPEKEVENENEEEDTPEDVDVQSIEHSCEVIDMIQHPKPTKTNFGDIGSSRYRDDILAFEYAGVVDGVTSKIFKPYREITRAEFIKMALISHCYDYDNESGTETPFTDLVPNSWQSRVFQKALKIGIIDGDYTLEGINIARPDEIISKIEMTKILMNISFLDIGADSQERIKKDHGYGWQEDYIEKAKTVELYDFSKLFDTETKMQREDAVRGIRKLVKLYDSSSVYLQ